MKRTAIVLGLLAVSVSGVCASSLHAADAAGVLKKWDPDKDGTLDLAEVKNAAKARFEQLDVDHDGTLDAKELAKAGINKSELAKHDPDKDATLDQTEYFTLVDEHFKAADPDKDGTIDVAELKTKAGQSLLRLIGR
jgi:Ca2+-binding EF-hand superfamily protein